MYEELLNALKENRKKDDDLQLELCEQLLQLGKESNNKSYIGIAYFYKADIYVYSNINKSESLAIMALQYLKPDEDYYYYAHLCNLLGILNANKNDISSSLDYFLQANEICDKYHLEHEKGLSLTNIGATFQGLCAYEKAIPYFEEASDVLLNDSTGADNTYTLVVVYLNLFECYYNIWDDENAKLNLEIVKDNENLLESPILLPLFEAKYAYLINDNEVMEDKIDEALTKFYNIDEYITYMDEIIGFCEFLYNLQKYSYLVKILDWIDNKVNIDEYPRSKIKLIKYRLKCVVEQNDFSEYVRWSDEYVQTFEVINANYNQIIVDSAEQKLYIRKLEAEK